MDNKTWEKELEEKVREAIRLKLIPGKGESITWEAYKDINKIEEFGYIGDAINGKTIHQNKYPEFFEKKKLFGGWTGGYLLGGLVAISIALLLL